MKKKIFPSPMKCSSFFCPFSVLFLPFSVLFFVYEKKEEKGRKRIGKELEIGEKTDLGPLPQCDLNNLVPKQKKEATIFIY